MKAGSEKPSVLNEVSALSVQPPRRAAAATPNGTPTETEISTARTSSEKVGCRRWPIMWVTGSPLKIDAPRSPRTICHSQAKKRMCGGSSRPSAVRILSICSGVAVSPASTCAGSPGVR
jgi:hypothetical protein